MHLGRDCRRARVRFFEFLLVVVVSQSVLAFVGDDPSVAVDLFVVLVDLVYEAHVVGRILPQRVPRHLRTQSFVLVQCR